MSYARSAKDRQSSTTNKKTRFNNNSNKLANKSSSHKSQRQLATSQYQTPISSIQDISKSIKSSSTYSTNNNNNFQFQPKLKISQPGDEYEQQADRVAEKVTRMSFSAPVVPLGNTREEGTNLKCTGCQMKKEDKGSEKLNISQKSSSIPNSIETTDGTLYSTQGVPAVQSRGLKDAPEEVESVPAINTTMVSRLASLGGSTNYPHVDRIQNSFGKHSIHLTKAYINDRATAANKALGAKAFTLDESVAFAEYPNLWTAAHEAAHVVQQRFGLQRSSKIQYESDPLEAQANQVADIVSRGSSAESLLDQLTPSGTRLNNVSEPLLQLDPNRFKEFDLKGEAKATYSPNTVMQSIAKFDAESRTSPFNSSIQGTMDIPYGTFGRITFTVDARYGLGLGEKMTTIWMIDARQSPMMVQLISSQGSDKNTGPKIPFFDEDELKWNSTFDGENMNVVLNASLNDDPIYGADAGTLTVALKPELTFPNAKVEVGKEVTVLEELRVEIKPFRVDSSRAEGELLDQIRDFWLSLSELTRNLIASNELPGDVAVVMTGYATTAEKRRYNFDLGLKRAEEVMRIFMGLSGNRDDKKIFRTKTPGEYESPEATDVKRKETNDPEYLKVVIELTNVRVINL